MFIASVDGVRVAHSRDLSGAGNPALYRDNPGPTRTARAGSGPDSVVGDGRSRTVDLYVENQLAILRSNSLLRRVVIKEQLAQPNTNERRPQRRTKASALV